MQETVDAILESPNDSGISTENTSLDRSPSLDCQCGGVAPCRCRIKNDCSTVGLLKTGGLDGTATLSGRKRNKTCKGGLIDEDSSSVASSDTSSFNSNCADDEEIALAMQAAQVATRNEARAKYR